MSASLRQVTRRQGRLTSPEGEAPRGRTRRRICVVFIAAMLGAASIANGQSEVTTGLLVPVDFNGVPDAAGVGRPGFRMGVGGWGEAGVALGANASARGGFELSRSMNRRYQHPGSAGYRATEHMQEAMLSGLLSVTTGTPRAQMLWLGGGGLVFSKMSEAGIGTGQYTEGAALDVSRSWTRPAVIGGVEHRRQIGRRLVLAFGCRARVTFLSDDMRSVNINMLTIVPRIGAAFRF